MRRIIVLFSLSLLVSPAWASVVAVHLGPQGAELTRSLEVGTGEVVVEGLPPSLDIAQVRVEPAAGMSILGMDLRADFDGALRQDRRRELQQQLHDVEDQLALLEREAEDRELARALLGRVGTGEQGVGEIKTTVMQVRDALYRIAQQAIEARGKRRTLVDEQARLRAELQSLGQGNTHTQSLVLDVAGNDGTLRLQYPVDEARFEVRYRLRLDSASQSVTLEPRLLVSQNTGTDWSGVRLTASTTQPSYRLQVPDPWVQVLRPRQDQAVQTLRAQSEAAMPMADTAMSAKGAVASETQAQANTYDIQLEVPGRIDLPADNRPRPFAMPTVRLDAAVHARVVPQRDAAAYVHAEWTMPADTALVAGSAEVLRDGVVVGRTRLPQLLPGQSHAQGFGVDPALDVQVQRDPPQRGESFFGGTQRWLKVQTVRIASAHAKPMAVHMIDSVPVAGDEAISIELAGDAPSARDIDDRKGVHRWQTTLAPGGEHQWRTQIAISAPADMDLGL